MADMLLCSLGTRGDLRAETDWRSRKFLSECVDDALLDPPSLTDCDMCVDVY